MSNRYRLIRSFSITAVLNSLSAAFDHFAESLVSVRKSIAAFSIAIAACVAPAAYAIPHKPVTFLDQPAVSQHKLADANTAVKAKHTTRKAGAAYRHAASSATR